MSDVKTEHRIKIKDTNLGPVKAPNGYVQGLNLEYRKAKIEKDNFVRQAQNEINKDLKEKEKSEVFSMIKSCLIVAGIYLAIKFRTNLGYFKDNVLNLLKRKP